jgi:hypothetical protein
MTVAASMRRPVCVKSYESSANVFFSFISFYLDYAQNQPAERRSRSVGALVIE